MQSVAIAVVLRPIIVANDRKSKSVNNANQPNPFCHRPGTQTAPSDTESFMVKEYSKTSIFMNNLKGCRQLLKRIPVLLLAGASLLNTICFFSQLGIWPAYFEEIGLTKADAALLLSIAGLSEMVTRPIVGYLCTKFHLIKPVLVAVFGFVAAGLGFAVSFKPAKWIWCLYSPLFAAFGGIFLPLSIPMFVDVVGHQKSGTATGLFLFSLGLGFYSWTFNTRYVELTEYH